MLEMQKEISNSARKYREKKITVSIENSDIVGFLKQIEEMKRFRPKRRNK